MIKIVEICQKTFRNLHCIVIFKQLNYYCCKNRENVIEYLKATICSKMLSISNILLLTNTNIPIDSLPLLQFVPMKGSSLLISMKYTIRPVLSCQWETCQTIYWN